MNNCRKCGCLILETDERCPMCDTKQRKRRDQKSKEKSQTQNPNIGGHMPTHNRGILVGFAIVVGIVLFAGFAFFLITQIEQIEFDTLISQPEIVIIDDEINRQETIRFSLAETPLAWDFTSNDLTMINQMNQNMVLGHVLNIFMADDAVYMMTTLGDIIRTTDYFETYDLFFEYKFGSIMFSFHLIDGKLYYTARSRNAEGESVMSLYRYHFDTINDEYDLDYLAGLGTGQSEQIVENVFSEVIINNKVFYKTDSLESNLYVFDMTTGENQVLIEQVIRYFIVDYANERLIFEDNQRNLYQSDLDGANQIHIHDRVGSFAFNGEFLVFTTILGDLFTLNFKTYEQQHVWDADLRLRDLTFLGQAIIARSQADDLYLIDLADLSNKTVILDDISPFASIGNHLIYTQWDGDDINRLNLLGESKFVRMRWN